MEFSTRFPYSEMELSALFPRYLRNYNYFLYYREFRVISVIFKVLKWVFNICNGKNIFRMQENRFQDRRNRSNRGNHGYRCTTMLLPFFVLSQPPRKIKMTVHHALWFIINSLFHTFRKRECLEVQRNVGNNI